MALENFTLGLAHERYFPAARSQGTVEGWIGQLDSEFMVTVFYGDYTNTHDDEQPGRYTHMVTIRSIPPNPQNSKQWFGSYPGQVIKFRTYVKNLDALTLKCMLIEQGYFQEVT